MPDRVAAFSIKLEGTQEALAAAGSKRAALLDAMDASVVASTLRLRGRIVGSFGTPGFPRRLTGRLSRGVRSSTERSEVGSRGVVGEESKVPYARILELGGIQPARIIVARRKKALRWTTGLTRLGSVAGLDFGLTRKQAFAAPRSRKGRAAEASDSHFARFVIQPSRYQRAIPFFGPAFDDERLEFESDLKARLATALGG